jgi:hypothetical protein
MDADRCRAQLLLFQHCRRPLAYGFEMISLNLDISDRRNHATPPSGGGTKCRIEVLISSFAFMGVTLHENVLGKKYHGALG